jgi:hypothetical protein
LDRINHDVSLKAAEFNGRRDSIEVPDAPLLQFGRGEYSITADVFTYQGIDSFFGDSFSKFDAGLKMGFNLTPVSNLSAYNSRIDQRQLFRAVANWFGSQSYFNGSIREVRLYHRALSEEDIHQLGAN